MTATDIIDGVYLSSTLDLAAKYGNCFEAHAAHVRLWDPAAVPDASTIKFALAWSPAPDAFEPYSNLRLACSIAAGVDSIIACPSLPADALVTRVRDQDQADFMAGFAAWHTIWHHRNMGRNVARAAEGVWERYSFQDMPVPARYPVGVLGYGLMGKAVAKAVSAMGFPVLAAARSPSLDALPEGIRLETGPESIVRVAEKAEILINVLPLTPDTHKILNKDLFARMPRGAKLIQLGRGEHLVESDLEVALDIGQLSAASLDVFGTEPLPPESHWWRDDRILITPHQASDTTDTAMALQVTEAARAMARGQRPGNAIDRRHGY